MPAAAKACASTKPGWACVPAGSLCMGSPKSDREAAANERPVHKVTLTRPFLVQKTEVTQRQWRDLMKSNPSFLGGCDDCPVESVSWWEAVAWCNALSAREGLEVCYAPRRCRGSLGKGCAEGRGWCEGDYLCDDAGFKGVACKGYRLPTEAEWEHAARAGSKASRHGAVDEVAWHFGNSGARRQGVGKKAANAWGLQDMLGNLWEWCWDFYDEKHYRRGDQVDPVGPPAGEGRVLRGGSWRSGAADVRAVNRNGFRPGRRDGVVGFRCVRTL
jgi:formylglycine-generating enzyme required for sulfatase activity